MPRTSSIAARSLLIVAVGAFGVGGLLLAKNLTFGGLLWLGFLFFAFAGLGYFLTSLIALRYRGFEIREFALLATVGTAVFLVLSGPLLAAEVCNLLAIRLILLLGFLGFAVREFRSPVPMLSELLNLRTKAIANPRAAAFALLLTLFAFLLLLGGVTKLGPNVWDDDVAYNAFLKRLIDIGEMNEPFSFRRLSAYGGQIVLNAAAAARGSMDNVFLIDHGLFQGLFILLTHHYASKRKMDPAWHALLILLVLLLPNTSINTASYYSGAAMFLAMYIVLVRIVDTQFIIGELVVLGILGAATATLRQNYIPVVALMMILTYFHRVWPAHNGRSFWSAAWVRRNELLVMGLVTLVALAPYCIAAYSSNKSFLYPLMPGTWNTGIRLTPVLITWLQELQFFCWVFLEQHGVVVVIPLFVLLVFGRDKRAGSPLTVLFLATVFSFLFLIHSFTSSDPQNLWRYAFPYGVALTVAMVVEFAPNGDDHVVVPPIGRWILVAALLLQLTMQRTELRWRFRTISDDIVRTTKLNHRPESRRWAKQYEKLQSAMPPGAKVMTMLDAAANLDFSRNQIAILDMPGWCGLGEGYPSFEGPQAIRKYLLAHGFRYLAYVRHEASVALYRREGWLQRLFTDVEVSQMMGAYLIDTIDSFDQLATQYKVLFDDDEVLLLDLEAQQ